MKDKRIIILGLIGVGILSAITLLVILNPRIKTSDNEPSQHTAVIEEVSDTTEQVAEVQQTADPTQSEMSEEQIPPTPRAGLESTDPASVNLASGEIQLVEAFAFW